MGFWVCVLEIVRENAEFEWFNGDFHVYRKVCTSVGMMTVIRSFKSSRMRRGQRECMPVLRLKAHLVLL